jgi:hypothetical protein
VNVPVTVCVRSVRICISLALLPEAVALLSRLVSVPLPVPFRIALIALLLARTLLRPARILRSRIVRIPFLSLVLLVGSLVVCHRSSLGW